MTLMLKRVCGGAVYPRVGAVVREIGRKNEQNTFVT